MFTLRFVNSNPALESQSRSRTTPDLIADALRTAIARGDPPPGGALRQEELADRFGVSRIPVREALRRLEAEGLVVVHANRGAFVSRLQAAEVREIYDLRVLLECDLLSRSIGMMRQDDVFRIESALMVAERSAREVNWSELDDKFHAALYAPANRPRESAIVGGLRGAVRHYQNAHAALRGRTDDWLDDHRRLLKGCEQRDIAGACRHLKRHLTEAAKLVIDYINVHHSSEPIAKPGVKTPRRVE